MAIAVFVKTPGLSPLKTRLAKTIGEDNAHQFYRLACCAIAETLDSVAKLSKGSISIYWALAENGAAAAWPQFPAVYQGGGDLGDKLHRVYSSLLQEHESVVLIGADAPHLEVKDFLDVHDLHQQGSAFVVGPARDGGFYLFSGSKVVPEQVWTQTPYSSPETLDLLLPKISQLGQTNTVKERTDVDVFSDLAAMLAEAHTSRHSTTARNELFTFVESLIKIG